MVDIYVSDPSIYFSRNVFKNETYYIIIIIVIIMWNKDSM